MYIASIPYCRLWPLQLTHEPQGVLDEVFGGHWEPYEQKRFINPWWLNWMYVCALLEPLRLCTERRFGLSLKWVLSETLTAEAGAFVVSCRNGACSKRYCVCSVETVLTDNWTHEKRFKVYYAFDLVWLRSLWVQYQKSSNVIQMVLSFTEALRFDIEMGKKVTPRQKKQITPTKGLCF